MSVRMHLIHEARDRADRERRQLGGEIRQARRAAGLPMRELGRAVRRSESWVSRVERGRLPDVSHVDLAVLAAAAGLRLWSRTYPGARAIHDAPQLELLRRFRARVGPGWSWHYEVILPDRLDQRAADAVISNSNGRVMVEAMTRLANAQAQIRGVAVKARDLGIARTVIVVRASAANRGALGEAAEAVAAEFPLGTRAVLGALRLGRVPGANGIVLL